MTVPSRPAELQVQPERVIRILQARLTDEISKTALLEAGLQEAQERERALVEALTKMQRDIAEQQEKDEKPDAGDGPAPVRPPRKEPPTTRQ